jgi:8-oxo-dGTP diphosphatase
MFNRGPDVVVALIEHKEKPEHFLVQYRAQSKQYSGWLEFPGGKMEPGENPESALCREVREEVDITIAGHCKFVEMDYLFPSGLYHKVIFYFVKPEYWIRTPIGMEGQRIGWLTLFQIMTYPKVLPLNRAAALILTTERHPDILE